MSEAQARATPPPPPGAATGPGAAEEFPRRFGKYTLLRPLAVGGMAELFLALQKSVAGFEKLIVVKRILPKLSADKAFVEMLLDEARIAATLNHPNVAHIYDVGVWDDEYYIAMEHIHGEDLRSIVRQMKHKRVTSFPLEHTLAIVLGCCKGLAYAHERRNLDGEPMNIVHRDVSPQNVLVTFSGDVKLVDFGIAKAGRSSEEDTRSGQLKGKVPYMSPEQAQGAPLDSRSDVFSLGVILYELCTGRRLFKGKSELETLKRIVEGPYPAPRDVNPYLSPRLESIIQRTLARDRRDRYQHARELQADLEAFIRDEQLAVSAISLGEWMQSLFDEKLTQQKELLQEGRQLAEVLAAQIQEEERRTLSQISQVRPRSGSKLPWIALAIILGLGGGGLLALTMTDGAEPAQSAPAPGVITVASDPPGAAIWIDGERYAERTPTTLRDLPAGRYAIKLTADGFAPFAQDVVISADSPAHELDATLARATAAAYGIVAVRTAPSGAAVFIDGRDTGQRTPATIGDIDPAIQHTVMVSLDGWQSATAPLSLGPGDVKEIALELERAPLGPNEAILFLHTDPLDAEVTIDGERQRGAGPHEVRLAARRAYVEVSAAGYETDERRVRLPGGERTELTIELERDRESDREPGPERQERAEAGTSEAPEAARGPGKLTFDARPWCNVTLEGEALGQTPIVNRSLPSGRYRLTCSNPELDVSKTVMVTIAAGETTRQRVSLE